MSDLLGVRGEIVPGELLARFPAGECARRRSRVAPRSHRAIRGGAHGVQAA